jgi:superfamily I DNA/RNA helicase
MNFNNTTIIYGGPGTGKTTRLLEIVEREIENGTMPSQIAYVSFTKKATEEAKVRAADKFDLDKDDLNGFRTIHSLAYNSLGISHNMVMQKENMTEIGDALGLSFTKSTLEEGFIPASRAGDKYSSLNNFARSRNMSIEYVWDKYGRDVNKWAFMQYCDTLHKYKEDNNKLDYTDFLHKYLTDAGSTPYRVAIIDEAQDLSTLQWRVVQKAFANCDRVYIGGDDDQSINTWAGADPTIFLNLEGTKEILKHSHRLPETVFNVGIDIVKKIKVRQEKDYAHTGKHGHVNFIADASYADIANGEWLLLARNQYMLNPLIDLIKMRGISYVSRNGVSVNQDHVAAIKHWERLRKGAQLLGSDIKHVFGYKHSKCPKVADESLYTATELAIDTDKIWHDALTRIPIAMRSYYLSILKQGNKLDEPPRVTVSTIHSAKGGEADNVLLCTDMSKNNQLGYESQPDFEHRVWYVGATRAKESLHIVAPKGIRSYPVPLN